MLEQSIARVRKTAITSIVFSLGSAISISEVQAASFESISQIYAYGDSYSDDGLSLEISTAAVNTGVPDSFILPADPALGLYDDEGRWTNGQTAVEILSQNLQVNLTNYAFCFGVSLRYSYMMGL